MGKRLLLLLVVVLIVAGVGGYTYYHVRTDRRVNGGEVVDQTTPDGAAPIKTPTRSEIDDVQAKSSSAPSTPAHTAVPPIAAQPPAVPPASDVSPTTDTITANPPNGAAFAGTGKFQVYRQGDLTWRIDTTTGKTCILFATEEQWRKPVVYRNGCSSRQTLNRR